jgi:xylulokinase
MTEHPLLLGVDVGTTGCKAAIIDAQGNTISADYREYAYELSESTIDSFLDDVLNVIKTAAKNSRRDPSEICGVGFGSLCGGRIAVDRDGNECLIWSHHDTTTQRRLINKKLEGRTRTKLPNRLETEVLWIRENRPEIYQRAHKFLALKDYLEYKFTNETKTDCSEASASVLFDIHEMNWSDEICSLLEVDMDKLPQVVSSTSVVGVLTRAVSERTGLKQNTPVVAGAIDDAVAMLGLRVIEPGYACDLAGTVEDFDVVTDEIVPERPEYLPYCIEYECHVIPERYILHLGGFLAGGVLRWFRDQLGSVEVTRARELGVSPYSLMDKEAGEVKPGADGLVFEPPSSEYIPSEYATHACLVGLSTSHLRPHVVRAMMEGIAFKLREVLQAMRSMGLSVKEVIATGGCARSSVWNQMKADVLDLPVSSASVDEPGVLGAAAIAGVGVGLFHDPIEAADKMARHTRDIYRPDADSVACYNQIRRDRSVTLGKAPTKLHNRWGS